MSKKLSSFLLFQEICQVRCRPFNAVIFKTKITPEIQGLFIPEWNVNDCKVIRSQDFSGKMDPGIGDMGVG